MAFPYIDESRPLGTQMVSTIDDAERETRSWLKKCMEEITDYPNTHLKITSWTTSQKPTYSGDGYLIGYNSTEDCLELIGAGSTKQLAKEMALFAHPVGEYYWTDNAQFNPNTAWGGTWERIQDGRVLIASSNNHAVGSTGGTEVVTLTEEELPRISHTHSHDRGTMNITGYFSSEAKPGGYSGQAEYGGAFYLSDTNRGHVGGNIDDRNYNYSFDASRTWEGETSQDEMSFGGGQAHTNMQPYRAAILWHRVA